MPVTVTNSTTALIKETYAPWFEEEVYRNNALLGLFGSPVDSGGDTGYRWKINTAGNSSVGLYTEGASQPAAGQQSYVNAVVSYLAWWFTTQVTGHARAALRSGWLPAIEEEQILGQKDMIDLINTTFMASTYGLEAAVAATGSYAGLTRGSIPYFESYVAAVNNSVSNSDIMDMLEALKDNERGQWPNLILGPVNQESNLYRLSPVAGMRQMNPNDNAQGYGNQSFAGIRLEFLPDWTDTVIMALHTSHVVVVKHQGMEVYDQGRSGDSDVFMTTYMGNIVHKRPRLAGKLTGCTA